MLKFKHPRDKSDLLHYARIVKNVEQLIKLGILSIQGKRAQIYKQSFSGFKEDETKNLFTNIYIYNILVNKFDPEDTLDFTDTETSKLLGTATKNNVQVLTYGKSRIQNKKRSTAK